MVRFFFFFFFFQFKITKLYAQSPIRDTLPWEKKLNGVCYLLKGEIGEEI